MGRLRWWAAWDAFLMYMYLVTGRQAVLRPANCALNRVSLWERWRQI